MVGLEGKVYAIDVSDKQMEVANARIEAAGLKNVEFIKLDIISATAVGVWNGRLLLFL